MARLFLICLIFPIVLSCRTWSCGELSDNVCANKTDTEIILNSKQCSDDHICQLTDFLYWIDSDAPNVFHCTQKPRKLRLVEFINMRDSLQKRQHMVPCSDFK